MNEERCENVRKKRTGGGKDGEQSKKERNLVYTYIWCFCMQKQLILVPGFGYSLFSIFKTISRSHALPQQVQLSLYILDWPSVSSDCEVPQRAAPAVRLLAQKDTSVYSGSHNRCSHWPQQRNTNTFTSLRL